jgi:hypothetical protein
MMRMRIGVSLIFVICCSGAIPATAQFALIKDRPYEATKTRIIHNADQSFSVSGRVARNSDSSTYEEITNKKTGEIELISILDVPGQRQILLDVKHKRYTVSPASIPPLGAPPSEEAKQKNIKYLKELKPSHESDNGAEIEVTPLGFRTLDGFQEFGTRRTYERMAPSSSLKEKVWEVWWIPEWSIRVESIGFDADNNPSNITRLSNIETKEPDPQLFEIPKDYTAMPASSPK